MADKIASSNTRKKENTVTEKTARAKKKVASASQSTEEYPKAKHNLQTKKEPIKNQTQKQKAEGLKKTQEATTGVRAGGKTTGVKRDPG